MTDTSAAKLIDEAKTFEERAKESPESVASDLPRLIELVARGQFEQEDIDVRSAALVAIITITEHNPEVLGERYQKLIEITLDTSISRVLVKRLLHGAAHLIGQGVTPKAISRGTNLALESAYDEITEFTQALDSDGRVPSNGGTAMHLYDHLEEFADSVPGREQLMVEVSARAFRELVLYRAASVGTDPIDGFYDLKSSYETSPKPFTMGFNQRGEITDVMKADETDSMLFAQRCVIDAYAATTIITLVERTEPQLLRAEAVLSERVH